MDKNKRVQEKLYFTHIYTYKLRDTNYCIDYEIGFDLLVSVEEN